MHVQVVSDVSVIVQAKQWCKDNVLTESNAKMQRGRFGINSFQNIVSKLFQSTVSTGVP